MSTERAPEKKRRSNAERSAATRSAVLDATITAIVRYGYRGATSERIAEISGLTRGAQKHHWSTKAEMVVEALLYLHDKLMVVTVAELDQAAGKGIRPVLDALWRSFQTDLFTAADELHVAARSEGELRPKLIEAEREIGRRIGDVTTAALDDGRQSARRLGEVGAHAVNVMRGMAFQSALLPSPEREQRQLTVLEQAVAALLEAEAG
ncbi:DNA-binding transcriptional regulator, AcrR family [Prauserella marina]|uniref:DNA-binding transcriptional regulator, AcrR family n=1 Tax=Prauserella marina TaxID=530584 RepID=A0A1G6W2I2_9PSEU|nr:TetR/AcrR family transcriptional regulator [Prauserella marina]PWV73964.1 TetR family transcriptional regulator [Prauserella marina]SDD59913.1 DNA-binding transcriptional regulator, AcrR family [Prauserella marina]